MSINNSDKEFYYALYTKFYKDKIEEILNIKLNDMELDKNINGRKIDIQAIANGNKEVFMELQLNSSDNTHLNQLLKIIKESGNKIILVWIATGFRASMLDEIEVKIKASGKNIRFIALKLNEKVIDYLKILNNMFINEVMENLKILNEVENHFEIIEIFYRLQDENNTTTCVKNSKETLILDTKQEVMNCLLKELRKQIYYYPSIHRDKQLDNGVIVLGAGKSGVSYFTGINRKNMLFVQIKFEENQRHIFQNLLEIKEKINDKLDYLAEFDVVNRKIGTYIYFTNNNREMLIKRIARIVDKYIRYFSQYTFPNGIN
jgi:hypothetical protein